MNLRKSSKNYQQSFPQLNSHSNPNSHLYMSLISTQLKIHLPITTQHPTRRLQLELQSILKTEITEVSNPGIDATVIVDVSNPQLTQLFSYCKYNLNFIFNKQFNGQKRHNKILPHY